MSAEQTAGSDKTPAHDVKKHQKHLFSDAEIEARAIERGKEIQWEVAALERPLCTGATMRKVITSPPVRWN